MRGTGSGRLWTPRRPTLARRAHGQDSRARRHGPQARPGLPRPAGRRRRHRTGDARRRLRSGGSTGQQDRVAGARGHSGSFADGGGRRRSRRGRRGTLRRPRNEPTHGGLQGICQRLLTRIAGNAALHRGGSTSVTGRASRPYRGDGAVPRCRVIGRKAGVHAAAGLQGRLRNVAHCWPHRAPGPDGSWAPSHAASARTQASISSISQVT
jgi:hypothetical protein